MKGPESSATGEAGQASSLPSWNRKKDRYISAAAAVLIVYAMVRSGFRASVRPLWFDEVCTWILARMPNVSSVWHALAGGADSQPPAFYLLESFASRLLANQQIALRLPSILASGITLWCLFIWLRRRYEASIAFAAVIVPLLTVFYSVYALEARPYALVLACLGLALVCYDRVPAAGWTAGLALCLISAESFHYYALITMAPFVAAESVYVWKKRIVRWWVWVALVSGVAPLLVFWRLLTNFRTYYGQHFWAKPTVVVAARTYGWLFDMPLYPLAFARTTILALILGTGAVLFASHLLLRSLRASADDDRFSDSAIVSVFLLLPFVFFIATKLSNGGFTERYALPVALGLALATGYGLSRLSRRAAVLIAALVFFCFGLQEFSFWKLYRAVRQYRVYWQKPIEEMVSAAGYEDLPVMVTEPHDYLQIVYYADAQWKKRFVFVADPETAVKYGIPDGSDKELQVLRNLVPLNVVDYSDFRPQFPRFLVCSTRIRITDLDWDWWLARLDEEGYRITALKTDGRRSIYLVEQRRGAD